MKKVEIRNGIEVTHLHNYNLQYVFDALVKI